MAQSETIVIALAFASHDALSEQVRPCSSRQSLADKLRIGHKNGNITTHYSGPELQELIDAAERFVATTSAKLRQ